MNSVYQALSWEGYFGVLFDLNTKETSVLRTNLAVPSISDGRGVVSPHTMTTWWVLYSQVKVQLPDLDFLHWDSGDKGSGHKEESGHEKDSGHKEDSGQGSGQEARFPGAFVLYNYARMATILSRHKHLVDKGTLVSFPGQLLTHVPC